MLELDPARTSHSTSPRSCSRRCSTRGKPLCGYVAEGGYWQDIGNIDQYQQANRDALDGKVQLELPGVRLRENVYLGDGVACPSIEQIEGPAVIGNYCAIDQGARDRRRTPCSATT